MALPPSSPPSLPSLPPSPPPPRPPIRAHKHTWAAIPHPLPTKFTPRCSADDLLLSLSAKKKVQVQRSQEVVRGRLLLRNYTQASGGRPATAPRCADFGQLPCAGRATAWPARIILAPHGRSHAADKRASSATLRFLQAAVAANYDYNIRTEKVGRRGADAAFAQAARGWWPPLGRRCAGQQAASPAAACVACANPEVIVPCRAASPDRPPSAVGGRAARPREPRNVPVHG